jgi:acetate kinase
MADSRHLLVCNAGSSSLKVAHYALSSRRAECTLSETFEGTPMELAAALQDHLQALPQPAAILHRIVHAGRVQEALSLLDEATRTRIKHWAALAPAHNPLALHLADVVRARWPDACQLAAFDSGLYCNMPDASRLYALPADLSPDWPIERYGFHGLAHRSQWRQVTQLLGERAGLRLISIHLGSGCSLTAWRSDTAVDTSMGFTPLEGVAMARRSGSVDPGILLHLLRSQAMTVEELDQMLRSRSGLAALGGGSGDMRELLAAESAQTRAAVAHYCYQIRKQVGAFIAVLGGVDAISFGGGVAEHQPRIRQQILEGLGELGIHLDAGRNLDACGPVFLHEHGRQVAICLTPVNEMDEMIRQYQQLFIR